MRSLFIAALVALPFVVFAVLTILRKARYRSLAEKLGAKHVDTGLLKPGAITGDGFRIETEKVGKQYRTNVQVAAGDTPGPFWLTPEFFHGAPNWAFAKVSGAQKNRVFLWELTIRGYVPPSREQQDELLRWLPRLSDLSDLRDALKNAGVRTIVIADGTVTTHFNGIASNVAKIRGALEALRRLVPSSARTPAARRAG